MNRRFSKALALIMAVSLCATPVFADNITFNANAGTDEVTGLPAPVKDSQGAKTNLSTSLTREGYTFKGWAKDKDGKDMVTSPYTHVSDSGNDVTLYAIWDKNPADTKVECVVTITVNDADGKGIEGATVKVTGADKTEVAVTEGSGGKYTFTATAAGTYSITVTKTGYSEGTGSVEVAKADTTKAATISLKAVEKVETKVDESAPNDLKGENAEKIETTVEEGILEAGEKVVIGGAENQQAAANDVKEVADALEKLPEEANHEERAAAIKKTFKVFKPIPAFKALTNNVFTFKVEVQNADGKTQAKKDGTFNVTIPIPSQFKDKTNLLAIHYHNGEKRLFKPEISATTITITLEGLSDIALVEYTPDPDPNAPEILPDDKPGTDEPTNPGTSSDDRYVAYNPGGSSGGSGGGGGGSSSSNRGTSMFNSLTNTINGILKSQLSKGTVGAASAVTGTATAPVSTPATQAAATRAISQAVSKARANGSNSAEAIMQNVSVVSASILESIAAEARKSGVNAYLSVDTMKNGIVDVRVRIPVSAASRLGRDVNMASVDNTAVKARFNRYYSNRLDVVALAQNGSFGVPASVAARLALGNANAADLHFYSFNAATNSYQEMVQTGAFVDVNGYLHFNTEVGGYIVVSVGNLELK